MFSYAAPLTVFNFFYIQNIFLYDITVEMSQISVSDICVLCKFWTYLTVLKTVNMRKSACIAQQVLVVFELKW